MSPEAAELALLRYPIGGPRRAASFTAQERSSAIEGIGQLPQSLRSAVAALSEEQLETPYRPGGWTVRQLVHHVADSHMNAYVRVRLALTEDWPTIVPYQENRWAELKDASTGAVSTSLDLLQALHTRWVQLFASLDERDWKRGSSRRLAATLRRSMTAWVRTRCTTRCRPSRLRIAPCSICSRLHAMDGWQFWN